MARSGGARHGGGGWLAWLGLLLVVAGVVGYVAAVVELAALPSIRNDALPNWFLVAAGLLVAVVAFRRARERWAPKALLAVDVVLAALFALVLYVMPMVPHASGPAIGAPAPELALADQAGRTVRLADLRGAPVLLVFYRGHW